MLPLAKVEAIEDENAADAQVLEGLQLSLDVALEGEGEATQRDQKRFPGGMVVEVLVDVVRRIDTDYSALECGEGKELGAADGPFVQRANCSWRETLSDLQGVGTEAMTRAHSPGMLLAGALLKFTGKRCDR